MKKSKQPVKAQIYALDRIMDLIEERSYETLAMNSQQFATFVEDIYHKIETEVEALARTR
jgi:hypothetical protein